MGTAKRQSVRCAVAGFVERQFARMRRVMCTAMGDGNGRPPDSERLLAAASGKWEPQVVCVKRTLEHWQAEAGGMENLSEIGRRSGYCWGWECGRDEKVMALLSREVCMPPCIAGVPQWVGAGGRKACRSVPERAGSLLGARNQRCPAVDRVQTAQWAEFLAVAQLPTTRARVVLITDSRLIRRELTEPRVGRKVWGWHLADWDQVTSWRRCFG